MSTPVYNSDLSIEALLQEVSIDWDVTQIGSFDAVLKNAKALTGFERIQIYRDDIQVFDGRYERSKIGFGASGRHPMPINGFDWTRRLADFPTVSQTIVDSTTEDALTDILSETDFVVETEGAFEYITPLEEYLTYIDLLMKIDEYVGTGIELDLTLANAEISQEVMDVNTWTLCDIGLKACFFYGGTTQRIYVFAKNAAGDLYYYHSQDGVAWTAVDTGYNPTLNLWSVGWDGTNVILIFWDGANSDCATGTINDITGVITFVFVNNICASSIRFGPVFDDTWHVWIVTNSSIAYESTDAGLTWNNRFGMAELWGLAQVGSDGDMIGIVLDAPNTDLEEWLWDRSAGTFTFTQKIKDEDDVDGLDLCQDFALNIYVAYNDGNTIYLDTNQSGAWADVTVTSTVNLLSYSIANDRRNSYIIYSNAGGVSVAKYYGVTLSETWLNNDTLVSTPPFVSTTRASAQDGLYGIFFTTINNWNRVHFIVLHQRGVRLAEGQTMGYFYTETVTASGGMTSWGILTGTGEQFDDGESVLWNIHNGVGPFQLLANDEVAPFDLELAGVTDVIGSIVIYGYLDDNGTDPYVKEFEVTEKTNTVSLDTDYEDAYTAVEKLATLAGAEFYVIFDGTTWTLHFTTRIGEDKSEHIILKAASSSERPDIEPNIKVLNKEFDWTNYANIVRCVGGVDVNGDRIVEHVRDNAEIANKGQEYWVTIRSADAVTSSMTRQVAYLELIKRNVVKTRLSVEFLDKEITNKISVGDSVMLLASWDSENLEIKEAYRIISLHRQWGASGETVTAELSNNLRYAEYINYVKKTDDHDRWLTA